MVSAKDVLQGDEKFVCRGCGTLLQVDRVIDPAFVDSVTIPCDCGHEHLVHPRKDDLPEVFAKYKGHRVVFYIDRRASCIDCGIMSGNSLDDFSAISDHIAKIFLIGQLEED